MFALIPEDIYTFSQEKYYEHKFVKKNQIKMTYLTNIGFEMTLFSLPDFELRASWQVGGQLLDEWQQHGLAERARVLTEHLLRVDGLTHIQDQVQICRWQSLGKVREILMKLKCEIALSPNQSIRVSGRGWNPLTLKTWLPANYFLLSSFAPSETSLQTVFPDIFLLTSILTTFIQCEVFRVSRSISFTGLFWCF